MHRETETYLFNVSNVSSVSNVSNVSNVQINNTYIYIAFVCQSNLSVCLSIYLSIYPSIYLSIIYISIYENKCIYVKTYFSI